MINCTCACVCMYSHYCTYIRRYYIPNTIPFLLSLGKLQLSYITFSGIRSRTTSNTQQSSIVPITQTEVPRTTDGWWLPRVSESEPRNPEPVGLTTTSNQQSTVYEYENENQRIPVRRTRRSNRTFRSWAWILVLVFQPSEVPSNLTR